MTILLELGLLDKLVWSVSLISALLLNLDVGLGAAVLFSLFTIVFRTQRSRFAVLGVIPGSDCYKDMKIYSKVKKIPGVTIISCSNPLFFSNSDLFFSSLRQIVNVDRKENPAVSSRGYREYQHCVILELSAVSFMDSTAINMLTTLIEDLNVMQISLFLASCPDGLLFQMKDHGLVPDGLARSCFFHSVHHAVRHWQNIQDADSGDLANDSTPTPIPTDELEQSMTFEPLTFDLQEL